MPKAYGTNTIANIGLRSWSKTLNYSNITEKKLKCPEYNPGHFCEVFVWERSVRTLSY
jgi:hypothetical protein